MLGELVAGVEKILGDGFCGAYLQGSFAVGDADVYSDVDFIVVTEDEVAPAQRAELQALHQRLFELPTPWAQHLEGSYVPKEVLRRPDPERRPLLYLDNGATEFALDNHDNTAVVRWSLREHGVVLAGPGPRELVDPITADELRAEMHWAVGEWQEWFRSIDSIDRRALAVAVLTHARILHTLAIGEVSSKRVAGEWALEALDPEWAPLIRWALEDRPDPWAKVREPADPALLRRTLQLNDYAAGRAAGLRSVSLREITNRNREAVLALHVSTSQERYVSSVAESLEEARETPEGNPWYRAVYAGEQPVGFVMLSWNVTPDPPRIIGPWFLWKLLIDERHQGSGYGRQAVELVADIARDHGASELLTSCVTGDGSPEPFYRHIGFAPTGEQDEKGETILALDLQG